MAGLGFLPCSNAVHYTDEPGRQSAFLDAVAEGMAPGYGVGDAAALHFIGTDLAEVVSSRPEACARYVYPDGQGGASERELAVRFLGDAGAARVGASPARGEALAA